LPEFSQLLLDVFSLFDSQLLLVLLYDSVKVVINEFSFRLSGRRGHGLRERKSREPYQLEYVAGTMHVYQCAVFVKEKMSFVMV